MNEPQWIVDAWNHTGAEAIMLARGALGNPWLFARLLGEREAEPTREEVLAELDWVMDRAVEHLGPVRAGRYLRKFYPWYVDRMDGGKELHAALQQTATVDEARAVLASSEALQAA
jgi:tRNA-dihydrouridine synthase B